jgi:hypothetical protein
MDEGLPIAYEVLQQGVPVYTSDGVEIGTVSRVFAAPSEDIFHGIDVHCDGDQRFVAADQIASLHERGVDLRISAAEAKELPGPEHAGPGAFRVSEPGVKPSHWKHLLQEIEGVAPVRRNWTEEK